MTSGDDQPATPIAGLPSAGLKVLTSAELLGPAREIAILHAGEVYRLRLTSNDRLILTK
jgi:hemin uptake protein HemP